MTLSQAPGVFGGSSLAARARDESGWVAVVLLTAMLALLIVVLGLGWMLKPASIVLGLALGGCFALSLSLIVLRAGDAVTAALSRPCSRLSAMPSPASGPLGFGFAHEASGGWAWPAAFLFCAIGFVALACGLGAGRDRQIRAAGSLSPDAVRTG